MAEPADDRFDVGARFVQISGRGGNKAYLPVQARIDWFRHDYPEGLIDQEIVYHDERQAIFKATVTKVRDGVLLGRADGYGQEYASAFPDYLLKAATVSIGRALNALGFGGSDLDEGVAEGNIADAPVDRSAGRGEAPTPIEARRPANAGTPASTTLLITEKQLKFLWAVAREKGLSDDDVHAETKRRYGKESTSDLTRADASAFLDVLQAMQPKAPQQPPAAPEPPGLNEDGAIVAWTPAWKRLRELGCDTRLQWEGLVEKAWPADDPQAAVTLYEQAKAARDRAIDGTAGNDRYSR
jgi:hypothetical protein